MGYFRRPIDRARSRAEARGLLEQPVPDLPWESIPAQPPTKACFVRFSTLVRHLGSGRREGIFTRTYDVLRKEEIEPFLAEGLQSSLEWFEKNLRVPGVSHAQAIYYFKSTAVVCMARAWELLYLLREAGVVVEMQTVDYPGRLLYEDAHQVAAIPGAKVPVK